MPTVAYAAMSPHLSPPSSTDELAGDAARLLTVARDLLATHLTNPDSTREFARTPAGAEPQGTEAREHIVKRAAECADHLAALTRAVAKADDLLDRQPHLADAYRPRDLSLAEAALSITQAAARVPHSGDTRLVLPTASVLGSISYPAPQEDPVTAAEEARSGLEQLATAAYRAANSLRTIESPPTHTASELRECDTSLAMAHVLTADLLTRLGPLLPTYPRLDLRDGAHRLRAAGAAWIALRRPWQQVASIPDGGPRSPLTIQANSIAVRLGRLLYADPTWNPQNGPGQPRPVADLLEPRLLDSLCMAISTLSRCATTIGTNHARLIAASIFDPPPTGHTARKATVGRSTLSNRFNAPS